MCIYPVSYSTGITVCGLLLLTSTLVLAGRIFGECTLRECGCGTTELFLVSDSISAVKPPFHSPNKLLCSPFKFTCQHLVLLPHTNTRESAAGGSTTNGWISLLLIQFQLCQPFQIHFRSVFHLATRILLGLQNRGKF